MPETTKPLYDKFLDNLKLLGDDIYSSEFDITNVQGVSLILGVLEATKKLLRMKNPSLSEDQADLIVTPKAALEQKRQERERRRREKEERKALTDDEKKALSAAEKDRKKKEREERARKREERQKQRIDEYKKIFDDLVKDLEKQVIKIINDIKEAAKQLWQEFKNVIKSLINAIIQTASAIAAIVIIIAAPPWNLAQAVSHMIMVVEQYLGLLKLFKDLLPWFKPFELLPLVCEKKNLKIIASIFNPIIQGLRAFWIPIKLLNKLINDLIKKISDYLNRNKASIFRKATRKLKKLGHLYRLWFIHPEMKGEKEILGISFTFPFFPGVIRGENRYEPQAEDEYPCWYFEEEDISEIQGLLDNFVVGFEGNKQLNRVVAYRKKKTPGAKELSSLFEKGPKIGEEISIDDINLDEIADIFDRLDKGIEMPSLENLDTLPDEDRFIYDIELPDGTIIQNITEEGIEYYQQNYILKYLNAATASYQQALSLI
jgi:hypothetical protein